jgi:hypothetical protein
MEKPHIMVQISDDQAVSSIEGTPEQILLMLTNIILTITREMEINWEALVNALKKDSEELANLPYESIKTH